MAPATGTDDRAGRAGLSRRLADSVSCPEDGRVHHRCITGACITTSGDEHPRAPLQKNVELELVIAYTVKPLGVGVLSPPKVAKDSRHELLRNGGRLRGALTGPDRASPLCLRVADQFCRDRRCRGRTPRPVPWADRGESATYGPDDVAAAPPLVTPPVVGSKRRRPAAARRGAAPPRAHSHDGHARTGRKCPPAWRRAGSAQTRSKRSDAPATRR